MGHPPTPAKWDIPLWNPPFRACHPAWRILLGVHCASYRKVKRTQVPFRGVRGVPPLIPFFHPLLGLRGGVHLHPLPALQGSGQSNFIGVFQGAAERQPAGQAGELYTQRGDKTLEVHGRGLTLQIGVGS